MEYSEFLVDVITEKWMLEIEFVLKILNLS
jgi:hypothetical protein